MRGADRIDHDGTYIDRELFHWEQGLKRLVLGAFMSGPQSGDDRVYESGESEYLPYDQPADALADIGRLLALMRSLVADARFARSAQLTMTEWSAFFARMVNAYLAADYRLGGARLVAGLAANREIAGARCQRPRGRLPDRVREPA